MTTVDQVEANKKNAESSTGPKTEEGKSASRKNAIKHGLLTEEVLIQGENEEILFDFTNRIRTTLQPVGEIEELLVEKIIIYSWRLRRVLKVERMIMEFEKEEKNLTGKMFDFSHNSLQLSRKATISMIVNDGIEKLTRYEAYITRSFYKALHELQRIQSNRLGLSEPISYAVDYNGETVD